ncbi:SDR family oxidoreductase [Nocardia sp. CDC160]|uniref:SDR family oxidoreductase n=1 Tax=Nocardia sp. CDC160 TaxID=3112166 RepID=UPI002DB90B32|nr:NAD(P)H-binding protein [Nocardia sp. CDC160]MEC3914526.1 NAD(P)H-binding protein [Nocardia sp. CDC160]
MSTRVAVAGATGRLGSHVVEVLREQGHEVVEISRAQGVDIVTGEGLAQALRGVEMVIDAASTPSPDEAEAIEFFTASARNLHAAGHAAGVRRLVVVSIIGIQAAAAGYNRAKQIHEQEVLAGPVPVAILRAAQFDEFVELLLRWGTRGEVAYLPRMRTQLVAARTVAEELVRVAFDPNATAALPFPEVAGPREERLADAAALVADRLGLDVRIEEVSDPANPDTPLNENGGLLPSPHAHLAGPTFADWIDATYPARTA